MSLELDLLERFLPGELELVVGRHLGLEGVQERSVERCLVLDARHGVVDVEVIGVGLDELDDVVGQRLDLGVGGDGLEVLI